MNKKKETVAVIIPSRYASTRFPAKALAPLCGRPMVQHVVEKATASQAVPEGWSTAVITARPPKDSTASRISS